MDYILQIGHYSKLSEINIEAYMSLGCPNYLARFFHASYLEAANSYHKKNIMFFVIMSSSHGFVKKDDKMKPLAFCFMSMRRKIYNKKSSLTSICLITLYRYLSFS